MTRSVANAALCIAVLVSSVACANRDDDDGVEPPNGDPSPDAASPELDAEVPPGMSTPPETDARADARARPPADDAAAPPAQDAAQPPAMDAGPPLDMDAGVPADVDAGPPPSTCAAGEALCPSSAFNSDPSSSYRCRALIDGACPMPDLIVVGERLIDDTGGNVLHMTVETFDARNPAFVEGCVHDIGERRLLRFNFTSLNQGNDHFRVGRPDERDELHWMFSPAHGHFHIQGWADYRLRTLGGTEVANGRKTSFCLEDNIRMSDRAGPREFAPPLCELFSPSLPYEERPEFGLSPDWGDEYPAGLVCQWIDLGSTDTASSDYVPDGFYDLVATINPQLPDGTYLYRESSYSNNAASVRVEIRGDTARGCESTSGDPCSGGVIGCDGACAPR